MRCYDLPVTGASMSIIVFSDRSNVAPSLIIRRAAASSIRPSSMKCCFRTSGRGFAVRVSNTSVVVSLWLGGNGTPKKLNEVLEHLTTNQNFAKSALTDSCAKHAGEMSQFISVTEEQTVMNLPQLTLPSRIIPMKLSGLQLVKKLPAFYGARRFITVFTKARHLSPSWDYRVSPFSCLRRTKWSV